MSNIVITGASGFIGRHLSAALISRGHQVTCLTRDNNLSSGVAKDRTYQVTDFSKNDLVLKLKHCDALVHLAGRRLTREDEPNMAYPFIENSAKLLDNLLHACKENNVSRMVTASSIGVYSDENSAPYDEREFPKPATVYGLSKLISEQRVDLHARKFKMQAAHIRLTQCYGFGEKSTPALMNFIEKAINKETITLNDGGKYPIDEVYIDDAVEAFISLIETNATGSFNIGGGKSYSILELAITVNNVFGNKDNIKVLPSETVTIKEKHMSIEKAKQELNWEPKYTLEDGLRKIKEQYNKRRNTKNENT